MLTTAARAQETTERLILKDGSYQSVEKYEMQGDRVHYLSAERYEWEDIPASLIDWDATKKYNEELSSGKLQAPHRRDAGRKRGSRKRRSQLPGDRARRDICPAAAESFCSMNFKGKPELAEIVQNGSEAEQRCKERACFAPPLIRFAGNKQGFEIKGEHAQIQSHICAAYHLHRYR